MGTEVIAAEIAEEKELLSARIIEEMRPVEDANEGVASNEQEPTTLKGTESLPQTEQQSLWTAFSDAQHAIRPLTDRQKEMEQNEGVRYFAQNPRNQLTVRFMDNGVKFESGYPGREWAGTFSLGMESEPIEIRQDGTRLEYVHDGIIEWYHNKPEGMEQGFIVTHKISEGSLMIPLLVDGLTVESLEEREGGSSDLQLVNEAGEVVMSYSGLMAWDANGIVLATAMAPMTGGLRIMVSDADAIYPITIDPLIASLEQKLGPEVTGTGSGADHFGGSVSVDGETALIGVAHDDDSGTSSGSAYVFVRSGTNWIEQAKLTASDAAAIDLFGISTSISGDTALVGAYRDDDNGTDSGSAYVFVRSGTVWSQQANLTAGDGSTSDWFGWSVSMDVDTALVGAYKDDAGDTDSGSAYVFVRSGTNWNEQTKLTAFDGAYQDSFGKSVSISGDTALIGVNGDDDDGSGSGSAYVFVRNGSFWSEQTKLTAADAEASDSFGSSVSVDGDTALIGVPSDRFDGHSRGSAYVFVRSGTNWSEQAKLSDLVSNRFGWSVSISGDTVLIGAYLDDGSGSDSGNAYMFVRSGTSWSEQEKLTAGDGSEGDYFGVSVSVSGDTALIGASYDDDNGNNSGSAYVFERSGANWSEQAKLMAGGNGAGGDYFGSSVSVSGDTAVVGDPNDANNSILSGSAYIFVRSGTNWSEQAKLIAFDAAAHDQFGISVSISGDMVLVGAYGNDDDGSNSGSAYVFARSGSTWIEQAKLAASDATIDNLFGWSVSLFGKTALVGRYAYTYGSAYVFVQNGTNWNEQAKLTASDGAWADRFGASVSVSGDTVLIGAYDDDDDGSSSGSAYVFVRNGTNWSEQVKLTAGDSAAGDYFGRSVSVDGDTVLIGADNDDDGGSSSGSAYVFIQSGTNWSEQAKLTASAAAAGDYFGYSVSVSGDTALVGAYRDDNGVTDSGSAYAFVRSGASWSEEAKLTASDAAVGDYFGCSVSISGDTALIGAYLSDGLDLLGDPTMDQGSAYIYRLIIPVIPPGEIKVESSSGILLDGGNEDFGSQAVGLEKVLIFTISNDAVYNLTGLGVTKDGADTAVFEVAAIDATSLGGGESTTFRVTYTPLSEGSHTAAIHIASNDPDENPFDITLTGTGLANADSDLGSDAWETANGFDPNTSGDVMTLDSDGDDLGNVSGHGSLRRGRCRTARHG